MQCGDVRVQQRQRPHLGNQGAEQTHIVFVDAAHDVVRAQILRVLESCRLHQFTQCLQRLLMELVHPFTLVQHHQGLLPQRVLRGHARRAGAGVAVLGLYAAQRKHETACAVAPVGAQRHQADGVKRAYHLAGRAQAHPFAQAYAGQGVVDQQQAFLQRCADMVGELQRRRASAAFGTVNDDEIRCDAGFQHGLGDRKPFPGMADAELETGGFAAGQFAQPGDELQQLYRRAELAVRGRRHAVHTYRHAARLRDLGRHLGAGQHATMAGLGALAEFDFNHLDLRFARVGDKALRVKTAVLVAAAEIAGADFPDQVATLGAVVHRNRTFAGIVGKTALACAGIQCADGVGRQCTKTHRGNIEHAGLVGLGTVGTHCDAKVV